MDPRFTLLLQAEALAQEITRRDAVEVRQSKETREMILALSKIKLMLK